MAVVSRTYDVTIDFNEDPTGATAATDQDLCGVLIWTLDGVAHPYQVGSDHAGSTGSWSQVSGIGTVSFTDANLVTTAISADLYGEYVLRWTETNGSCLPARTYDVTIDFNEDPTGATAATDQDLCGVLIWTLDGVAHPYQVGSDHAGSTGSWSQVSGIGTVSFTDANLVTTAISADLYGEYVLRWTETNGSCVPSHL